MYLDFELGVQSAVDVPIYVMVGFMQRDPFVQLYQNNVTSYRTTVSKAHCIIGREITKCRKKLYLCHWQTFLGNCRVVSCFRHSAESSNIQPYFTQKNSLTSNVYPRNDPSYNLYVVDIHHLQDFKSAQPILVRFRLRPAYWAAISLIGYTLLLTKKVISIGSAGRRQFDFKKTIIFLEFLCCFSMSHLFLFQQFQFFFVV